MMKLREITMRDPYILPYEGAYYLYGTVGADRGETSLYVYRSTDMENWEEPVTIFTLTPEFWGVQDLWAPEVHIYNSKFYLFFSVKGENGLRGTQIAVCDTPDGTFVPVVDHAATPLDQSCIDGTLYIENGTPYMVYSHDWPDTYFEEGNYYLGEIYAVEMNADLTEAVGEPFLLFTGLDAPLSANAPTPCEWMGKSSIRYGTDGPFMTRLSDGRLLLAWSPIPALNYVVLGAVSDSGSIHGTWRHLDQPIFDNNGGHPMFFDDFDGKKKMAIHWPEVWADEHPLVLDVEEKDGTWEVVHFPL